MDSRKIARDLVKLAKSLTAGKIEMEKFVQGGFAYYLVKDNDEVLGYLRKGKSKRGKTFPWQAFHARFVSGGPPQVGKLIGAFYEEDGGKKEAIKALQEANRR